MKKLKLIQKMLSATQMQKSSLEHQQIKTTEMRKE